MPDVHGFETDDPETDPGDSRGLKLLLVVSVGLFLFVLVSTALGYEDGKPLSELLVLLAVIVYQGLLFFADRIPVDDRYLRHVGGFLMFLVVVVALFVL